MYGVTAPWAEQPKCCFVGHHHSTLVLVKRRNHLKTKMDALQAFKARLDVALGSLVWWLATLHIAVGWNW